jgi:hypothetical protein
MQIERGSDYWNAEQVIRERELGEMEIDPPLLSLVFLG